ncbi:YidC/Oxa1 family membrane protein insertase [Natronobacillus azotifigens]|uniref:Membrane protein insertase YidC n=1 Tax=Natronobacillus azotifigens TaxID=472978 RepID=A0A9J6R9A4_9BACI|nr:YidC family membrane integrase SpoIIIJ [Natronobacillus azotifigens]MCZ0702216.1 YidC family membrane integrase SpoIIIJ [Natronobacillus azotifigens]
MRKKVLLILALIGFVLLLTGCGDINADITAESEGFWDSYFVYPLSWVIIRAANFFNGSYGLAIVVVTVVIRSLLVPLNVKQLKSSKAMQEIQPELQAIREKYSSKDAQTQQKLQQETMKLFQENKVNPMAGCLPMLVQMPILIGFYHAIMRTPGLDDGSFLWFELSEPDPFYILPLVAASATFLQQKLTMAGTNTTQNAAMPQMTMMLYMMPLMIGVMSMFFPAALSLYWVVGNVFMVLQTIFIRKPFQFQQKAGGQG